MSNKAEMEQYLISLHKDLSLFIDKKNKNKTASSLDVANCVAALKLLSDRMAELDKVLEQVS